MRKTGIISQSRDWTQRIDEAVREIFRILLYVAQKRRPLSDVNDLRNLHAINGNTDLSLEPHIGVISDPSANYTSESVLQEMLAIAAEQVDLITSRMLKNSDVFALILDESTCNSNLSQLLIYSNQMVAMANDPDLTEP